MFRSMVRAAAFLGLVICAAGIQPSTAAAQAMPPMPVSVSTPLRRTVTDMAEFTGRFAASALVDVRAQVAGILQSVHFREGSIIKKGDLLFQIDPRTYQAAVDEARAQLEVARTRVDLSRAELTRGQELRQGGSIAESALQQRQQAFLEAQASLQAAQAALKAAEINLGFTRIEAPIGGLIGRKLITEGNLISAGAGASPLTTIVAIDPVHFFFEVDEQSYLRYRRGLGTAGASNTPLQPIPVKLALSDEAGFMHDGAIDFADIRLDPQSGTLQLRAVVPNADGQITPGLFGRVRMAVSAPYEALLVPDVAILSDQTRKIVMTVNAEDGVVPKVVELGPLEGHLRIIRSGLTPEDRVIVNGLMRAQPGGKVVPQPVDISAPPAAAGAAQR